MVAELILILSKAERVGYRCGTDVYYPTTMATGDGSGEGVCGAQAVIRVIDEWGDEGYMCADCALAEYGYMEGER